MARELSLPDDRFLTDLQVDYAILICIYVCIQYVYIYYIIYACNVMYCMVLYGMA